LVLPELQQVWFVAGISAALAGPGSYTTVQLCMGGHSAVQLACNYSSWCISAPSSIVLLLLLLPVANPLQNLDGSFIYTPGTKGVDDSFQDTAMDWCVMWLASVTLQ
jgi:hypothetical protein